MNNLKHDTAVYLSRKACEAANARQTVALQLACGIDLSAALSACDEEKERLRLRIERRLKRERMRGLERHWSYDLDRHIALKQALDRLNGAVRKQTGGI